MYPLAPLMQANPTLVRVLNTLTDAGNLAHLVGGSVRDALMGRAVSDFDIATSAHPETVAEIFEAIGATVYPTGIAHGTLTIKLDEQTFEITTWRRDVATDGRRATVAYAQSLGEDAARRDFTINALYADAEGDVFDPLGSGLRDIAAQRVAFIGAPEARIREDHLRILRYFRFSATHMGSIDAQSYDMLACRAFAPLISSLPRERVGAEMLKLLAAERPAAVLADMSRAGVLAMVLPQLVTSPRHLSQQMRALEVQEMTLGLKPCAIRRLALIHPTAAQEALKLSKAQARQHHILAELGYSTMSPAEIGYRHGVEIGEDALCIQAALGRAITGADRAAMQQGAEKVFPIMARDFQGRLAGKALGDAMRRAEADWIASGFTANPRQLLALA